MLFQLHYTDNHELEKLHQLLLHFFSTLANGATDWNHRLFPNWFEETFDKTPALKFTEQLKTIFNQFQLLLPNEKQDFYNFFIQSNQIQELCNNTNSPVYSIEDIERYDFARIFTKSITKPNGQKNYTYNFFIDAYNVLTNKVPIAKGVFSSNIKNHYQKYIDENLRMCPFCGLYNLPMPKAEGRADYDHYLDKVTYPFTSVNLRNLVPTCDICNSRLKRSKNVIIENGIRVPAFYPYEDPPILSFELQCTSEPSFNDSGDWAISITPTVTNAIVSQKISTWNRVFNIVNRYIEYIKEKAKIWLYNLIRTNDYNTELTRLRDAFSIDQHPFSLKNYHGFIPEKIFYDLLHRDGTILRNILPVTPMSSTPVIPVLT